MLGSFTPFIPAFSSSCVIFDNAKKGLELFKLNDTFFRKRGEYMKHLLIIFVALFSTTLHSYLASSPYCPKHFDDIRKIRDQSGNSIYQAHRLGGKLFRQSVVFTPESAALDSVRHLINYSQFSQVYHEYMNYSQPEGIPSLQAGHCNMSELFLNLYNKCIALHSNLGSRYERGKIHFDKGDFEECLEDIQHLAESGWEGNEENYLLVKGMAYLEANAYQEAIITLTEFLNKDPKNKEAFFQRALAYFEIGNFELALKDYLASEKSKELKNIKLKVSEEFKNSLLKGICDGSGEAIVELIPSLCESTYGLGECLWIAVQEPINSTAYFCNVCYASGIIVSEFVKSLDNEKIEELLLEVKTLYLQFDSLNDSEKGLSIGYCLGKYGTDAFAGGALLKGIKTLNKIKTANRIANLEALATSQESEKIIKATALKHAAEREAYFGNVTLEVDKQNKHIPGKHNYESNKGPIIAPNPEEILKKFAGKGFPANSFEYTLPGFKEAVDCGEIVGIWKSLDGTLALPTSKVIIHYSKKGAHMTPVHPNTKLLK